MFNMLGTINHLHFIKIKVKLFSYRVYKLRYGYNSVLERIGFPTNWFGRMTFPKIAFETENIGKEPSEFRFYLV